MKKTSVISIMTTITVLLLVLRNIRMFCSFKKIMVLGLVGCMTMNAWGNEAPQSPNVVAKIGNRTLSEDELDSMPNLARKRDAVEDILERFDGDDRRNSLIDNSDLTAEAKDKLKAASITGDMHVPVICQASVSFEIEGELTGNIDCLSNEIVFVDSEGKYTREDLRTIKFNINSNFSRRLKIKCGSNNDTLNPLLSYILNHDGDDSVVLNEGNGCCGEFNGEHGEYKIICEAASLENVAQNMNEEDLVKNNFIDIFQGEPVEITVNISSAD